MNDFEREGSRLCFAAGTAAQAVPPGGAEGANTRAGRAEEVQRSAAEEAGPAGPRAEEEGARAPEGQREAKRAAPGQAQGGGQGGGRAGPGAGAVPVDLSDPGGHAEAAPVEWRRGGRRHGEDGPAGLRGQEGRAQAGE
eukprot:scaffold69306_cov27-Prasinocladus_malaysianus.AAC.2